VILWSKRTKYGGSLSADAVRAELVNSKTNRKKTIYWNYPDVNPYVEWIDNDTVRIGEQSLNIAKGETYDWRKDDEWKRDLPKQRSEDDPYEKMREDPDSFSY
jgi:hypothetical protein